MNKTFSTIKLLSKLCLITVLMIENVSSVKKNSIKLFFRGGGHLHREDDLYLIAGKGCKTPSLLMEGKLKLLNKGKTEIVVQEDCKKGSGKNKLFKLKKKKYKKEQEHDDSSLKENHDKDKKKDELDYIPLPIPIPVLMHYYLLPAERHYTPPIDLHRFEEREEHNIPSNFEQHIPDPIPPQPPITPQNPMPFQHFKNLPHYPAHLAHPAHPAPQYPAYYPQRPVHQWPAPPMLHPNNYMLSHYSHSYHQPPPCHLNCYACFCGQHG